MDEFLTQKIAELKQKNLFREPWGEWAEDFLNFSTNDYLGLAEDERVIAAGVAAAEELGSGGRASRIAGGNFALYDELEAALAKAKGQEAACVFGSGYLANLGVIKSLVGEGDLILADKLVHSCIVEGAQLSGAAFKRFAHNDMKHAKEILQRERGSYKNCLIITEEIFSMDGDLGDLKSLRQSANEFDCWLMADGAHSLYNKKAEFVDVYIGTLSKAIGCYGGYVAGSAKLIEFIKTSAKTLIYSTALPPFVVASAIKSLKLIDEQPQKAMEMAEYFCELMNLPQPQSTIIPYIIGAEEDTLQMAEQLRGRKIVVPAIRPPTVPKGTSRLRISISAKHSKEDIEQLANAIKEIEDDRKIKKSA